MSKTENAWEQLFEKLNIDEEIQKEGIFHLSAEQIKEVGKREPRLMTKFDNKRQLPKILRDKHLSILPNTRGTYLIGNFEAYKDYEFDEIKPEIKRLPDFIQSVDAGNITSEPVALNMAKASGMIDEIIGSETKDESYLTLSGRMGSGEFSYDIGLLKSKNNKTIKVQNSQIEVDATYENKNSVAIFEAKTLMPENFMIRQLYYPYRTYKNLGISKEIIPIFFTYVDGIFSFNVYKFMDDNVYSSIKKIRQYDFILEQNLNINISQINEMIKKGKHVDEKEKFPQANSFLRVLDILSKLDGNDLDIYALASIYGFTTRQSSYYGSALVYLGYAERENEKGKKKSKPFSITSKGKRIIRDRDKNRRNLQIIQDIVSHEPFRNALERYIKHDFDFTKNDEKAIEKDILIRGHNIGMESTAGRRCSTVKHWIMWIVSVTKINES